MIAGCVLEDGLRKLCQKNGITLPEKPKLDKMNADLAKAGVLSKLVQKRITALADLKVNPCSGVEWIRHILMQDMCPREGLSLKVGVSGSPGCEEYAKIIRVRHEISAAVAAPSLERFPLSVPQLEQNDVREITRSDLPLRTEPQFERTAVTPVSRREEASRPERSPPDPLER